MTIAITKNVAHLRSIVAAARGRGKTIGMVPTMGALHAGHGSLLRMAREETGFFIASIFVNPLQFGPGEDIGRYPRTWDQDVALCSETGTDCIFAPEPHDVYPQGFVTQVDVGSIGDVLEGQHRPGHFRGVATVVLKLFNMVQPDIAYFGQKDAQQVRVIQQLVADLDLPIMLRIGPTIREADGLALSSRNRYLSPEERVSARCLYAALDRAKMLRGQGATSVASVEAAMRSVVDGTPRTKLDYVALVNPETFQPVASLVGPVLALIAVRIGSTRLIDNLRLDA